MYPGNTFVSINFQVIKIPNELLYLLVFSFEILKRHYALDGDTAYSLGMYTILKYFFRLFTKANSNKF